MAGSRCEYVSTRPYWRLTKPLASRRGNAERTGDYSSTAIPPLRLAVIVSIGRQLRLAQSVAGATRRLVGGLRGVDVLTGVDTGFGHRGLGQTPQLRECPKTDRYRTHHLCQTVRGCCGRDVVQAIEGHVISCSSVRVTASATWVSVTDRGPPDRGMSPRPAMRRSRKRDLGRPNACCVAPRRAATS